MEQKKKPDITLDWRTVTELLSVLIPPSTDPGNHGPHKVDDPPSHSRDTLHCILQRAAVVALVRQLLAEQTEEKQWCLDCRIAVVIATIYGPYPELIGGPCDCEDLCDDYFPMVLDHTRPDEMEIRNFAVSYLAAREPESFGPGWQPYFGNFGEPEVLVEINADIAALEKMSCPRPACARPGSHRRPWYWQDEQWFWRRSCEGRERYASRHAAAAAIATIEPVRDLVPYTCNWCQNWHAGNRMLHEFDGSSPGDPLPA